MTGKAATKETAVIGDSQSSPRHKRGLEDQALVFIQKHLTFPSLKFSMKGKHGKKQGQGR